MLKFDLFSPLHVGGHHPIENTEPEYMNTEHEECNLPVWLKLGVSFSPLHADGNHPIENEETGTRHSVVRKEQGNGER